ncbi:MAG: polymer-forming cytoskeletal protein [Gemmobacter sp.]|nr:polymer-forming cytoskeletal protein [Gemmobacter sp.]
MASIIAEDLILEGSLRSTSPVTVFGRVKGRIDAPHVTIAPGGTLQGDGAMGVLDLAGEVRGDVVAGTLRLAATGRLHGNLGYGVLAVAEGGIIEGEIACRREATEQA